MNVASFLKPKALTAYLYSDYSVRQALEKMRHHGYSAIPVIDREGRYVSTLSEGDLLWYLVDAVKYEDDGAVSVEDTERYPIAELIKEVKNPPVRITATIDELIEGAMRQNFIPVIDERDVFVGIVTRKDVMGYLSKKIEDLVMGKLA